MSTIPAWVGAGGFVGLPFLEKGRTRAGLDCWGLVRLVLAERFGVEGLPDYSDRYAATYDQETVAEAITAGLSKGWMHTDTFKPGVLVILRIAGKPWHCGLMVDRTWMLHTLTGCASVCERVDSLMWRKRVEGLYTHAS